MAASNCDMEMMDVFRGIELNYKLNSTISSLPKKQKFSAEQLEGYLKKKGISPYEIKASRLFDSYRGDNRAFTAAEWDSMNLGEQMFENKLTSGHEVNSYAEISLGRKGEEPDADYRVKEFMSTKSNKDTNLRHEFGDEPDAMIDESKVAELNTKGEALREAEVYPLMDELQAARNNLRNYDNNSDQGLVSEKLQNIEDIKSKLQEAQTKVDDIDSEIDKLHEINNPYEQNSQLGWNRIHQDEINGKPSTVLNELQSDWMQAERQGAGIFESKIDKNFDSDSYVEEIFNKHNLPYDATPEELVGLEPENVINKIRSIISEDFRQPNIIADFPMKPEKFQQLMIVDAINESIQNGTNKVVIPIQRENELVGTAGVTKFYEDLDKQLKAIKTKLGKSNLELKIGREDYISGNKEIADILDKYTNSNKEAMFSELSEKWDDLNLNSYEGYPFDFSFDEIPEEMNRVEVYMKMKKWLKEIKGKSNELHTIDVVSKPDTPVKWDVYALISSLGLTSSAMNMEAAQNHKTEGSMTGIKSYIADIESSGHGGYTAHNKSSGAKGKYQLTPIMLKDLGLTDKDIKTPAQQEKVMSKLVEKYDKRLKKFKLPVTKENIFIVHNLGMTGGIRVLRNHPTKSDISNMRDQLPSNVGKTSDSEVIHNYKLRYNIDNL